MDWYSAVTSFVSVIDSGSFVRAAEQLGITTSACSKRVSWLEQELDCQLLRRTTRRIQLTEQGQQFLGQSRDWLNQFQQIREQLHAEDKELSGKLVIGAPALSGSFFVTPLIASFLPKHPKLEIELRETEQGAAPDLSVDVLICREIDQFNGSSHRALHLFTYAVQLYASPEFVKKYGPINSPAQLKHLPLLLVEAQLKSGGVRLNNGMQLKQASRFRCEDPMSAVQAAVNHLGVVTVSEEIVQQQLADGSLQQILPQLRSEQRRVLAYYPHHRIEDRNIQAFVEHLRQQIPNFFYSNKKQSK